MSAEGTLVAVQEDANGVLRVSGTRVTLDLVVSAYENGATPEEVVEAYSSLRLADAYAAIAYYLRHRDEVDAYLARRRQLAEQVRRDAEARFPKEGVRERLLARRQKAA